MNGTIKIYKKDIVNNYEKGIVYKNPDGSFRLSDLKTKPNGSGSDYISIGKFIEKTDDFGDTISEWHHYGYPKEIKLPGFKFKSDYSGKGAQTKIEWCFLIPESFINEKYGIAVIGSGQGGKGYKKMK
jgi:hypothetical protein